MNEVSLLQSLGQVSASQTAEIFHEFLRGHVLTYAVISNYVHRIRRSRTYVVTAWSNQEVAIHWMRMFPGRRLEEHLAGPTYNDVHTAANQATVSPTVSPRDSVQPRRCIIISNRRFRSNRSLGALACQM
jgi:hypothetical protein